MSVRVVDKATGEYLTFEYNSFEDFAEQYDELTQRYWRFKERKTKCRRS